MQGLAADSGKWQVSGGTLQVAADSIHGDAVSVYQVGDYLPAYFEVKASIKALKPTAGWNAKTAKRGRPGSAASPGGGWRAHRGRWGTDHGVRAPVRARGVLEEDLALLDVLAGGDILRAGGVTCSVGNDCIYTKEVTYDHELGRWFDVFHEASVAVFPGGRV
jgi:hypothetical protein